MKSSIDTIFSRGHTTTPCCVGWYVGMSVCHIFEFRAVFALLLLPNRPRLDCRVSGLVKKRPSGTHIYQWIRRFFWLFVLMPLHIRPM